MISKHRAHSKASRFYCSNLSKSASQSTYFKTEDLRCDIHFPLVERKKLLLDQLLAYYFYLCCSDSQKCCRTSVGSSKNAVLLEDPALTWQHFWRVWTTKYIEDHYWMHSFWIRLLTQKIILLFTLSRELLEDLSKLLYM